MVVSPKTFLVVSTAFILDCNLEADWQNRFIQYQLFCFGLKVDLWLSKTKTLGLVGFLNVEKCYKMQKSFMEKVYPVFAKYYFEEDIRRTFELFICLLGRFYVFLNWGYFFEIWTAILGKKQDKFSQICLWLSKNGRVNLMERTCL